MNQSESWPKQSKDLKYHFKYQIPIPLKCNQKKGQYRYNTGKCSTLHGSTCSLCIYYGALILAQQQDAVYQTASRRGGRSRQSRVCQTSTDGRSMRYSGVRTTVVVAQSSGAVIGYTIFFRHENAVCLTQWRAPHALMLGVRRTKTDVCARAVRAHPCPWILHATTMRRTAGIKNKIGTRVERREKGSDRASAAPLTWREIDAYHPRSPLSLGLRRARPITLGRGARARGAA